MAALAGDLQAETTEGALPGPWRRGAREHEGIHAKHEKTGRTSECMTHVCVFGELI